MNPEEPSHLTEKHHSCGQRYSSTYPSISCVTLFSVALSFVCIHPQVVPVQDIFDSVTAAGTLEQLNYAGQNMS